MFAVQTLTDPPLSAYLADFPLPPSEQPAPAIGEVVTPGAPSTAPSPRRNTTLQTASPLARSAPGAVELPTSVADDSGSGGMSTGAVMGIVTAALAAVALAVALFLLTYTRRNRRNLSKAGSLSAMVRALLGHGGHCPPAQHSVGAVLERACMPCGGRVTWSQLMSVVPFHGMGTKQAYAKNCPGITTRT